MQAFVEFIERNIDALSGALVIVIAVALFLWSLASGNLVLGRTCANLRVEYDKCAAESALCATEREDARVNLAACQGRGPAPPSPAAPPTGGNPA